MLTGGRAGSRRAADPAYTPDIGHLVHRSEARAKSARARLAEVLSLTRTATKLRQVAHRKAAERGGSERLQYAGMPATSSFKTSPAAKRLHQQNDRGSPLPSLHYSIDKGITGTAASRLRSEKSLDGSRDSPLPSLKPQQSVDQPAKGGGHVSVVHVRSTSEPWRQPPSRELSIGGSGDCSRELSPVSKGAKAKETAKTKEATKDSKETKETKERWCDQEVDGVFLGRSGWVQVQTPQQQTLHPHRPTPGQFHSPRSEPLPSPQRPGYLPLPASLDLGPDMKRSPRGTGLARSDAMAHESPPASPPPSRRPLRTLAAARSVDESRRAYRESTSSSVSSFEQAWFPSTGGMRSLDSQTAARAMPRLSETDSSMGYDESDYSTLTMINSPLMPQPQVNLVERVSPSRGRQRMRRSPGSEKNGPGSGSSSSSSSPSQHWRRVPVASTNQTTIPMQLGRAYADASRSYADNVRAYSENNRSYSTEVGRAGWGYGPAYNDPAKIYAESRLAQQQADKASRVRRSRSLQLPERRSPNPPAPSPQPEYVDSARLVNGGKRPPLYNRNAQSEELRREAEEEARVVTEFLQSARSREAARNLIRSRLGATSDFSPSQPPGDAGYLAAASRRARLTRMTTAPTGPPPCNPSSCDFWPHCAHRDGLYSSSRASTPVGSHQPTMRLSHSYPNQGKRESPKYGYSSRSSPASLERVDTSPRPRRGMSLNIPEQRYRRSPDRYEDTSYRRESVHKAESYSEDWRHGRWAGDRPGSAPAAHAQQSARFAESTQRSLSLPKCFQAGRELPRPPRLGGQSYQNPPWSRRQSPSPGPMLRPPTPELSRTAPPTPVRELVDKDGGEPGRYSSTPLLEPPPKDWTLTGDWSQSDEVKCPDDIECTNHMSEETVLQKFRKSFSLRLHKKEGEVSPPGTPKEEHEKFRHSNTRPSSSKLGPLVWRSSKERKKKAARNAKCNSGDSGIQIEMAGSSESTDQPPDTDESPPIVRRRGTASSSDSRPSRPSSEVLNQFLIDRLKAELSTRRSPGVRRTHSDLGGQRLYQWELRRGYRRMISHPAPIRARPNRPPLRGSRGHHKLRRSVSQPLGLNELSPVLVRKVQASEDERGPGTSEDEALSDSESSLASLSDRKRSLDRASLKSGGILAEAVWDHVAMEAEELGFRAGDLVTVVDSRDRDWWWGESDGRAGWFPSLFVRMKVGQVIEEQTSTRKLSESEVRSRVVSELVATERDFVNVLTHLHDGYLLEARKRPDLLLDEEVDRIFCNLPQILEFQKSFLSDLEDSIDQNNTSRSKISPVFLKHLPGFRLYSEYCNGHAAAVATLEEVSRRSGVARFWEACRLMRGLMELPLSGYLLTPVQRICKYPLQLAELLKYTKTDHEDFEELKKAVEGMRGVAFLINERKRRMESLEKVVLWQRRVDAWQGEDLIERSCQLLHQGEATQLKLSTSPGKWSHNISLFLFDRQLIYCKRDILKRRSYVYKGRISLDSCQIINLPDGKDHSLNCTIRHGLKLVSGDRWLLFTVRSEQEKHTWLSALESERQVVEQELDLLLPESARELARGAASRRHHNLSSSKQRPKKRSKHREVGRWFRLGNRKHVFPS